MSKDRNLAPLACLARDGSEKTRTAISDRIYRIFRIFTMGIEDPFPVFPVFLLGSVPLASSRLGVRMAVRLGEYRHLTAVAYKKPDLNIQCPRVGTWRPCILA